MKSTTAKSIAFVIVVARLCLVNSQDKEIAGERHEQNDMKVPNTPEFKPVGCFKDRGRKPRPLPEKIANLRRLIDWYNLNKTITECARRVNKRGLHYFGIQFYGECWSGENAERTYNKQGRSTRCLHGVGKGHANFVYAFVEKDMTARLVNGTSRWLGRVEVFHRGTWGTICDKDWGMRDATVVCRMLGFKGAISAPRGSRFGSGKGLIRLGNVQCNGDEENLSRCTHKDYSDCNHLHDAGAVCRVTSSVSQPRIPYRLVGGPSRSEGRVEVFHERQWGTICDRGWDLNDAKILCRMLAYTGATAIPKYGMGSGRIWLSNVNCQSNENSIFHCEHARWGNVVNCDHSNDAGVKCY